MKQNKIVSIKLDSFSSAFEETITEECCREVLGTRHICSLGSNNASCSQPWGC